MSRPLKRSTPRGRPQWRGTIRRRWSISKRPARGPGGSASRSVPKSQVPQLRKHLGCDGASDVDAPRLIAGEPKAETPDAVRWHNPPPAVWSANGKLAGNSGERAAQA